MKQHAIIVNDRSDPALEQFLGDGLDEFNQAAAGVADRRPLCVVVRDPVSNEVVGGITGRTSLGLAFLDLFYLPESLRGSGLGTRMLDAFEAEARNRGCGAAVLYTISFQAPGFYQKNGWIRFGEIHSGRQGISRVFMSKTL